MTDGEFRDGHPRLSLTIESASSSLEFSFIIDTGFEGGLVLPSRLARQLSLPPSGVTDRALANGVIVKVPVLEVVALWEGERRYTELLVMEGNALIGTEFLADHLLTVEVAAGGAVSIEPL